MVGSLLELGDRILRGIFRPDDQPEPKIMFERWSAIPLEEQAKSIFALDLSEAWPVANGQYESDYCDKGHRLYEVGESYMVFPGHGGGNRWVVCLECGEVYLKQTLWRA